jgi:hypothetical protein
MPLYEYFNPEYGVNVEVFLPVDARPEEIVLRRRGFPRAVSVGTGAKPPTHGDVLMQGWKKHEDFNGSYSQRSAADPSAAEIKKICAMPDPTE